ncbi:MAG: type II toxin-antitoxin system ParD family antitoxin [Thermomicrobiales bacterium]
MQIVLDPKTEALIRAKVEMGLYADADEALREAVRLLDERDRLRHLRALLAVGVEQADRGELIDFTPEVLDEISREADELYRRGVQPDPETSIFSGVTASR